MDVANLLSMGAKLRVAFHATCHAISYHIYAPMYSNTWTTVYRLNCANSSSEFNKEGCLGHIRERMFMKVAPHLKFISVGGGILALLGMGTAFLALMANAEMKRIAEAEEVDQRLQVREECRRLDC